MRFLIGSVALGALLVAGPTLASEPRKPRSERSCFRAQDVNDFKVIDKQTVDVIIGPKTAYRLTLFAKSPDIDWSLRIGIRARGGSWICQGMDAEIVVPGAIGIDRYPVSEVRKLSLEEVEADKKRR